MNLKEFLKTLPKIEKGQKVISILSGGLDSTTLLYVLIKKYRKENVIAVTYNYGQKLDYEIRCAQETTKKLGVYHKIIDISFLGEVTSPVCSIVKKGKEIPRVEETLGDPQCSTYVPYRNQILLTLGFAIAESNNAQYVFYGAQNNDVYHYWDTTSEFLMRLNSVSYLNRKHKIQAIAPFINYDKADEIKWGVELGVDYSKTWSCYEKNDGNKACGVCSSCSDRIQHFMKAGIKDPLEYKINIDWEQGFKKFKE